jgi:hypothetical protein
MFFGILLRRGAGYGLGLRELSAYGTPDNWTSRGATLLFGEAVLAVSYAAEHLGAASGKDVPQDHGRCAVIALALIRSNAACHPGAEGSWSHTTRNSDLMCACVW